MQHKKPEYFEMLERFIDEFKDANGGATPSLKEIARNIGLAESTVSKYLKVMRGKGIVECEGRKNIITKQSRRDAEGFCRVPVLGAVACGIPKLAEENIEEYTPFQSTCPARGTTRSVDVALVPNAISIHVPREGHDKSSKAMMVCCMIFQSTCPARGTTRQSCSYHCS